MHRMITREEKLNRKALNIMHAPAKLGATMPRDRKRVLIATGWYDYRLHRGIEKYALRHNWRLIANLTRGRVIPWGWDGDGILAWLAAGDDLAEFVQKAKKPTVDFSFRRPHL